MLLGSARTIVCRLLRSRDRALETPKHADAREGYGFFTEQVPSCQVSSGLAQTHLSLTARAVWWTFPPESSVLA